MKLSDHVKVRNELYRRIKLELKNILPQLIPLIGKKIFLVDGSRSKNFDPQFIPYEYDKVNKFGQHSRWISKQSYGDGVQMMFSINVMVSDVSCEYCDRTVCLGKIDNDGKLVEVFDYNYIVSQWGLDEVLDLKTIEDGIDKIRELEKQIERVKEQSNIPSGYLNINFH